MPNGRVPQWTVNQLSFFIGKNSSLNPVEKVAQGFTIRE
tara:strand:- start:962 stop:1078 length:117 start_codon:yes stop_codon:yes gene_type:complete